MELGSIIAKQNLAMEYWLFKTIEQVVALPCQLNLCI
jgi:hypothetical protein